MKDLIIVGCGGCGREVLEWCKQINALKETWHIKGFLSDVDVLSGYDCDYGIIGTINDWEPKDSEVFALAVADPSGKELVVKKLEARGAQFVNIIHPRALISEFAEIGKGFVAYPNAIVGPNVKIGNFVTLMSSVGHDAVLGNFVTISSVCDICGHVEIGDRTFVASHCSIIPWRKIGKDSYIGAGSVVIRNVKPATKVFGNPAKTMEI